ncbi:papilin-like [Mizuhopecten yessoensis]|uniref:papilin-like n=1 Tax=Mizuhopecten yessoensis TaxID=6573 RepID=UPI000B45D259|nr:papilin-like [Mizuhopecten yessoensis]
MTMQRKVEETCTQLEETGPCLAYFRKFTYDAAKKTCREFIYGGCGGNSNRFDSLEDCQAKCQSNRLDAGSRPLLADHIDTQGEVKNDICNLSKETGPCRGLFSRFAYNDVTQSCEEFVYGGCGGNANRFDTMVDCETQCFPNYEDDICNLPKETGPCRGLFSRFAYNDVTQSCEEFVYGGCGGNANRFDTMVDCETQCLPNDEEDGCGLPLVTGPCRGAIQKYGYDTVSKACKEFMYGGCRGNGNRFDSMELCENRCEPTQSCDMVSCIIPIIVVVAIFGVAIIIAVVLIQKRRRSSNTKYGPTAASEPGDASELKKVSLDAENV